MLPTIDDEYQIQTPCITSNKYVGPHGYVNVTHNGKKARQHRVAFLEYYGNLPSGYDVCHRCDNRACMNPEHLALGTRRQNIRDASKKGRLTSLSKEQCLQVKLLLESGKSQKEVGEVFGVHQTTISNLVNGKVLAHT